GTRSSASGHVASSSVRSAKPLEATYPARSVLPNSATSGELVLSLNAPLNRLALPSTGRYSTLTVTPSCAASNSFFASATTCRFGSSLGSANSHTCSSPVVSPGPCGWLWEAWGGAQPSV